MNAQLQEIPLEHLVPSSTQSQSQRRAVFDPDKLNELTESIKTKGVLQPIVVRPLPYPHPSNDGSDRFEIVAGERRYRAANAAGLEVMPCVVRELDDKAVIEVQLIENMQREGVHPMHEAEGYDELVHKYGRTVEELRAEVGKSASYIYGRMKLTALSPKCRKAFYEDAVSPAIAERLARIPVHKLQDEALLDIAGLRQKWQRPMSHADAVEHIQRNYMLDLSAATFPVEDPDLNNAGPCSKCPKRTGNQPELFGDVKNGDICTDTVCFAAKTRAFGQRAIAAAKKNGVKVITGKEAKRIAPHGARANVGMHDDYVTLDSTVYDRSGSKAGEARKLLKPDAEISVLQDPTNGNAVEVVRRTDLKMPKRETARSGGNANQDYKKKQADSQAKAKVQTAIRRAIFTACLGKLLKPTLRQLAELVAPAVDYDGWLAFLDAKGIKTSRSVSSRSKLPETYVEKLKTDEELEQFLAEAFLADELHVSSYQLNQKMPRLEAAAAWAGVDVKAIRAELTPKPAKKASKKKTAKKTK